MEIERQERRRMKELEVQIKDKPQQIKSLAAIKESAKDSSNTELAAIVERPTHQKITITPVEVPHDKSISEVISDIYVQHQRLMEEFKKIREKTLMYKHQAKLGIIEVDYLKRQINEMKGGEAKDLPSANLNSVSIFIPVK
eukprot:TRINITY_DN4119_c0_g2_i1.p1 TRINITY_DN4119_c0_g2~~TRINITY_DN4119_c0_g2_i1.p1  ORF type:complete len:141 (+),score=36.83 TRINITY_DN4119_c0_g2_i1:787-1209(+)